LENREKIFEKLDKFFGRKFREIVFSFLEIFQARLQKLSKVEKNLERNSFLEFWLPRKNEIKNVKKLKEQTILREASSRAIFSKFGSFFDL